MVLFIVATKGDLLFIDKSIRIYLMIIENYIFERTMKNMKNLTTDLINQFKNYLISEEKSKATLEKYIRDITTFMLWLNGRSVDKIVVIEYKRSIMEMYAPASVNSMLSSINSFFIYMEWYECKVKTIKIQKQIFANKEKELTKCEYEKLLKAAKSKNNEKLYLLMQTICGTGIRVSELRYITTEAVTKGQAVINCKGKMRLVMLPDQLCKALKRYMKEQGIMNGSVFVSKNGRQLDRSNIWKMLKSLCETAGVSKDKVFPHNLRHLFARTYYSIEKDVVRLADILGHSSVNTTRIYTMETGEVHRMQIQRLGLLLC